MMSTTQKQTSRLWSSCLKVFHVAMDRVLPLFVHAMRWYYCHPGGVCHSRSRTHSLTLSEICLSLTMMLALDQVSCDVYVEVVLFPSLDSLFCINDSLLHVTPISLFQYGRDIFTSVCMYYGPRRISPNALTNS